MKRVIIAFAILLLAASATASDWSLVVGPRYETGLGVKGTIGFHYKMVGEWLGGDICGLMYGDFGTQGGSANTELLWIRSLGKVSVGFFFGPNVDVEDMDNTPAVVYLVGSTGFLGTYEFEQWGFWGAYKITMTADNENKNIFGAGVFLNL